MYPSRMPSSFSFRSTDNSGSHAVKRPLLSLICVLLVNVDLNAMPGIIQVAFPVPDACAVFRLGATPGIPGSYRDLLATRVKLQFRCPEVPGPGMRTALHLGLRPG